MQERAAVAAYISFCFVISRRDGRSAAVAAVFWSGSFFGGSNERQSSFLGFDLVNVLSMEEYYIVDVVSSFMCT